MTGNQTVPATPDPAVPGAGEALAEALAAEHAAIYAYGPIGVRLEDDLADAAREAEQVHRQRRDELVVLLDSRDLPAPAAAAAYDLPFPVTDADAARQMAVLVEERVAAVWRATLPELTGEDRERALAALVETAVRATGWRQAAGIEPASVPFPGQL